MEHIHKGRIWTAIGREPYTRKDGSQTELIRWRTHCVACGAPFEACTPVAYAASKTFEQCHCNAHKLTRSEVFKRATAQRKANKQKAAGSEHEDLC